MRKKLNAWICVFAVLVIGAIIYRLMNAGEGDLIPFQSLAHISELGYKAILLGFAEKALPFALIGLVLPLAIPVFNRGYKAAAAGALLGILIAIPKLLVPGWAFDTEEILLAALGMAIGFSLFAVIVSLIKNDKKPKYPRRVGNYAALLLLVVYIACMGVLLVDNGGEFVQLSIFVPDQTLPQDLKCSANLQTAETKALVYKSVSLSPSDEALRIAKVLDLDGQPIIETDTATIRSGGKELSVTRVGDWSYYDSIAAGVNAGKEPLDEKKAAELANSYLAKLLPNTNEKVITNVERSQEQEGTAVVNYETRVDGKRVRGSGEFSMTLGADGSLVSADKYNADFKSYKKVSIISAQDAFARIQKGNVAHTLFSPAKSAELTSCEIAYWEEEVKGVLQPIWLFSGTAILETGESKPFEVFIPAIK